MKLGFDLCFEDTAQVKGIYRSLFDKYVKFTPEYITYNRRAKKWKEKKHMRLLDSYDSGEAFGFSSDIGMFLTHRVERLHSYRSISIIQDIASFLPTEEDVHSIVDRPGFIAAYVYNEEYESIQTTPYESNHMGRQFSVDILASIKNTPCETNVHGQKTYKTKFNPGRSITMDYLHLMVAWKMWFGPAFFKLVSKERILAFPYATAIKQLSEDLVFVQLYDKVEEPYTPNNVFKQWKWREWLDYEGLEEKYPM